MTATSLTNNASSSFSSSSSASSDPIYHMRMALTFTHLSLVAIGMVNLLVILVIVSRKYMRSITNVYMIGLCFADFIYLTNLSLVAATQLNNKSWAFGAIMCTIYHGTETMGKYASVIFVVLLALDRYCAMCKTALCSKYRNFRTAIAASAVAWLTAIAAAAPLFSFADVAVMRYREQKFIVCIAKWPSHESARWYIFASSVLMFAVPLAVIVFCYYHIINKLREAVKGSKRMRRAASSRAPYHRVTRLVLWVVVFHVICWSPFWLFNLFSSIFRPQNISPFERVIINVIHLFPYINCSLNPLLYAAHAENFRVAFRSLVFRCGSGIWRRKTLEAIGGTIGHTQETVEHLTRSTYLPQRSSCYKSSQFHQSEMFEPGSVAPSPTETNESRQGSKKNLPPVFFRFFRTSEIHHQLPQNSMAGSVHSLCPDRPDPEALSTTDNNRLSTIEPNEYRAHSVFEIRRKVKTTRSDVNGVKPSKSIGPTVPSVSMDETISLTSNSSSSSTQKNNVALALQMKKHSDCVAIIV